MLFNIYACLFVERWAERVADIAGVGGNKHDQKLFRRYTRNADETGFTELQFADDAALLATTREGVEEALHKYMEAAADFGLTVSIPKTLMVTGRKATARDRSPFPWAMSR